VLCLEVAYENTYLRVDKLTVIRRIPSAKSFLPYGFACNPLKIHLQTESSFKVLFGTGCALQCLSVLSISSVCTPVKYLQCWLKGKI